MKSKNIIIGIVIVVVIAGGYYLYSKYGGGDQLINQQNKNAVNYVESGFEPNPITIKAGESITFTN